MLLAPSLRFHLNVPRAWETAETKAWGRRSQLVSIVSFIYENNFVIEVSNVIFFLIKIH